MNKTERKVLLNILFFPILFLIIMWMVKLIEYSFGLSFADYGVYPQSLSGLKGILFSPFIHGDFEHLINNSYPILILGGMLFSFYKKIAKQLFLWLFFIAGFWLWIIGRQSFHIGASGIIYALAAFLFISGIIRKNPRLSAVSMLIIFLYGSMIWGVLPTKEHISWEGHLSGFVAGILVAIFYRNEGPKRKKYQWEIDEEWEENFLMKIEKGFDEYGNLSESSLKFIQAAKVSLAAAEKSGDEVAIKKVQDAIIARFGYDVEKNNDKSN